MRSIWSKIDRLLSEKGELTEDELIDEIENSGDDIDEHLAEQGLTRGEALIFAKEVEKTVRDYARAEGLNRLETPYIWIDLICLCNGENGVTDERVKIILWLLAGGRFDVKKKPDDDILTQEEIENTIISVGLCYKKMCDYFDNIRALRPKYADILIALDNSNSETGNENPEFEEVFKMLRENGYTVGLKDENILMDNLVAVSAQISAMPFLNPIKPLVYFAVFVKYKKKMQQKSDFIPDIKKALTQQTIYDIYNDNGKNFKQYALYCNLYSDLKNGISGGIDKKLCDFGFLLLSNLANWRWTAGFLGCDCSGVTEDIPTTPDAFVYENLPACFDEFPYEKTGLSAEKFDKCDGKYDIQHQAADRIANDITFKELEQFADDPRGFCARIWTDEYTKTVNEKNLEAAWCVAIDTVRSKFNGMLLDELAYILNIYFFKILT